MRFTLEKDGQQCNVRRALEVTALDDVLMHISEKKTIYQLLDSSEHNNDSPLYLTPSEAGFWGVQGD